MSQLRQIFCACGHSSILWQVFDVSYTSGFVDDNTGNDSVGNGH